MVKDDMAKLKTCPFHAAALLDDAEAVRLFLKEARRTKDSAFLRRARLVVNDARRRLRARQHRGRQT